MTTLIIPVTVKDAILYADLVARRAALRKAEKVASTPEAKALYRASHQALNTVLKAAVIEHSLPTGAARV